MITELIVTDITKMHADRICIATINKKGESIRPLYQSKSIFRDWCFHNGHSIHQFSKIELDLLYNRPQPPHTEDWIVDDYHKEVLGVIAVESRKSILEQIADPSVRLIFGATIHQDGQGRFLTTGQGNRSLGTIRVREINNFSFGIYRGQHDYRLLFTDAEKTQYRIKIVDAVFQDFFDQIYLNDQRQDVFNTLVSSSLQNKDIFLRIGLARGWADYPERCYLQITGVYTFPDYMEGRSFATVN